MKDLGLSLNDINSVKKYWDARPCNIRHSKSEIGTIQYFNEVEARKYFVEPHIPEFANFNEWKGKKVLEIGCGIGTDAINFAKAGAFYTGTDLSTESIELTKRRFQLFSLQADLFESNFEILPDNLKNEKFDLIYSFGVIHHSPNPRIIIENSRKIISDDGELRIMLYAKESWKSIMIQAGLDQPEAQFGCPIAFTFSEDDVQELLNDYFEILQIRKAHIFQYNIEKYTNYIYEKESWFKSMSSEMIRALEESLGWHLLISAKPI